METLEMIREEAARAAAQLFEVAKKGKPVR